MNDKDISKERVPFNWVQFIMIISFVVSLTAAATKIHAEFESMRDALEVLENRMEKKDTRVNERVDVLENK